MSCVDISDALIVELVLRNLEVVFVRYFNVIEWVRSLCVRRVFYVVDCPSESSRLLGQFHKNDRQTLSAHLTHDILDLFRLAIQKGVCRGRNNLLREGVLEFVSVLKRHHRLDRESVGVFSAIRLI